MSKEEMLVIGEAVSGLEKHGLISEKALNEAIDKMGLPENLKSNTQTKAERHKE